MQCTVGANAITDLDAAIIKHFQESRGSPGMPHEWK